MEHAQDSRPQGGLLRGIQIDCPVTCPKWVHDHRSGLELGAAESGSPSFWGLSSLPLRRLTSCPTGALISRPSPLRIPRNLLSLSVCHFLVGKLLPTWFWSAFTTLLRSLFLHSLRRFAWDVGLSGLKPESPEQMWMNHSICSLGH